MSIGAFQALKRASVWLMCLLPTFWSATAFSQDNGLDSESFVILSPKIVEAVDPVYPSKRAANGVEGWVVVNFMVDTNGKPYEPVIIDSTGQKDFENVSVEALMRSKYQPATLDGDPVDGSVFLRHSFFLADTDGAGTVFKSRYRNFTEKLGAGELDEAKALLEKMDNSKKNRYEAAFVDLSKALWGAKTGAKIYQMNHLRKALAYSSKERGAINFLPEDIAPAVRANLLSLQIENRYFSEAVSTYRWMVRNNHDKYVEMFSSNIEELERQKNSVDAYSVEGQIDGLLPWYISLFKDTFYIDEVNGQVDEISLYCAGGYRVLQYQELSEYVVPPEWGDCGLMVVGGIPDTTFSLVQLGQESAD